MALSVKPGREYVLGGKVYKGGDDVPENLVQAKYKALLTSAKGPLSASGPAKSPTDLPKEAMVAVEPATDVPVEEAAPEAPAHPQTYERRDMVAKPAGQTGPAGPSRSSRRGHRQKGKG